MRGATIEPLCALSCLIYQFDPQGNAVHLLDDDGHAVLANLAYDAWGQLTLREMVHSCGYTDELPPYACEEWGYNELGTPPCPK